MSYADCDAPIDLRKKVVILRQRRSELATRGIRYEDDDNHWCPEGGRGVAPRSPLMAPWGGHYPAVPYMLPAHPFALRYALFSSPEGTHVVPCTPPLQIQRPQGERILHTEETRKRTPPPKPRLERVVREKKRPRARSLSCLDSKRPSFRRRSGYATDDESEVRREDVRRQHKESSRKAAPPLPSDEDSRDTRQPPSQPTIDSRTNSNQGTKVLLRHLRQSPIHRSPGEGFPWSVYDYYNRLVERFRDRSVHINSSPLPPDPLTEEDPPQRRRPSRALTGKHVKHGTGASPATLVTLRQKIQERQRAKALLRSDRPPECGKVTRNMPCRKPRPPTFKRLKPGQDPSGNRTAQVRSS